jgi:hypothetical protein
LVSILGGCGDLDIWDGDLDGGKDERDVLVLTPLPFELEVPFVVGRTV